MQQIRNAQNRLICYADGVHKIVEIVIKGSKTTIQFLDGNLIKVVNAETTKK
jgi:hypothetical protein